MKILISLLLYPCGMITFAVCLVVYTLLLFFFTPLQLQTIVRFLTRLILFSSGQWLRIRGKHPLLEKGPYLHLFFPHASLLDAMVVGAVLKGRFTGVAADKYFKWPIWGKMMRLHNIVSITRPSKNSTPEEREAAIASMENAEEKIRQGWSILGFPEGTRTYDGKLQKIKKGFFHSAKKTGAPVSLIVIHGGYRAFNRSSWLVRPGVITATFLRVIHPEEYMDITVDQFIELVRQKVIIELGDN